MYDAMRTVGSWTVSVLHRRRGHRQLRGDLNPFLAILLDNFSGLAGLAADGAGSTTDASGHAALVEQKRRRSTRRRRNGDGNSDEIWKRSASW